MENMSLRAFAKYAKVSPQRLYSLIKEGKIKQLESGLIPASEFEFFIRERLLKQIATNQTSVLFLDVVDDEKIYNDKVDFLSKTFENKKLTRFNTADDLVKTIALKMSELEDEEVSTLLYKQYVVVILKEFKKRYLEALQRHLSRVMFIEDIAKFPLISLVEALLFNQIITNTGVNLEDIQEVLNTKYSIGNKEISLSSLISASFTSLVKELAITDIVNKPLLVKEQITPEFFKEIDDLKKDTVKVAENSLLAKFFNDGMVLKFGGTVKTSEAEKIKLNIINTKKHMEKASTVNNLVDAGLYSIRSITNNTSFEDVQVLINEINQGYYSHIIILCDEEYFNKAARESLKMTLLNYSFSHAGKVIFGTKEVNLDDLFKA